MNFKKITTYINSQLENMNWTFQKHANDIHYLFNEVIAIRSELMPKVKTNYNAYLVHLRSFGTNESNHNQYPYVLCESCFDLLPGRFFISVNLIQLIGSDTTTCDFCYRKLGNHE